VSGQWFAIAKHFCKKAWWAYFARSLAGWLHPGRLRCPACGSGDHTIVKRKALVTALVRCKSCELLFRIPTDPPHFAEAFYQEEYVHPTMTPRPSRDILGELIAQGFVGSGNDFTLRIEILRTLGVPAGARILDFGASWGYGTWQLQQAGYEAHGLEVSRPRARYAREALGMNVVERADQLQGPFDVFFSSHVLEHLPAPSEALAVARRLVRANGLFVAFTPNGSAECLRENPRQYHLAWGLVHPHFLDERFYRHMFPDAPKLLASSPYDLPRISAWDRCQDLTLSLAGPELLFVVPMHARGDRS
jgi:2-polyprenyl-3-methyl-5-hydroxy-6-metoxy-1,4-benzoquinol methylase